MINLTDKYKTRCGYPVEVLCVDLSGDYTVLFTFVSDEKIKCYSVADKNGSFVISNKHHLDLIKVAPYDHIKKGNVVLVWDDDISTKYIKFFIEYKNSHITTSPNTDFTNLQVWDNCELYQAKDEK